MEKTWTERYPQETAPLPQADQHDFRDRGDPLEKVHPDPQHWSREDRQDNFYIPGGGR